MLRQTNKQTKNKKPIHTTLENTEGQYRETSSIGNTRHMPRQTNKQTKNPYTPRLRTPKDNTEKLSALGTQGTCRDKQTNKQKTHTHHV